MGALSAIRTLLRARRSARVIMLVAVLCMASLALVALPAFADDPTTTTTTVPAADTTTTTVPPDTTTTTVPPEDTTTTTVPPEDTTTTIPTDPGPEISDLSPDEALASLPAFVNLSGGQRAVLQRLQTASDIFATRRFALVKLAPELATAKVQLKAARVRERMAVKGEVFGLAAAAVDRDDATDPAASTEPDAHADVSVLDTGLAALDELAHHLESERKSARRARVQAKADVAALNALVATQSEAVTEATTEKTAAESAAESALGSDAVRAHADGITALLATAQADQTDPILLDGIAWPIPGATLGSPFGIRIDPLGGGAGFHPGVDIDASSGTPIHAAAAGVVVMAGDCGGYGYCVVIDHGTSVATVYGHQSALLTQVGDHVDAGQVIGLVGSTGMSTGAHLHFEVRLHGIPVDPLPTLTA